MAGILRRLTAFEASSTPDLYVLRESTLPLANILAAGYFDQFSEKPQPGDLIIAFSTDTQTSLLVTGNVGNSPRVGLTGVGYANLSPDVQALLEYILATLETGLPYPSPSFSMTIADDSLVAQVNSITTPHTQWEITVDDDTAPTVGDGTWTDGTVGGPFPITGNVTTGEEYDAHDYYLFINDGTTVTQVSPPISLNNGSGGINLQAVDTLGYVWVQGAVSVDTYDAVDPTTQVIVTVDTPPTANIPQSGTLVYRVWNVLTDPPTLLRQAAASPIIISNRIPGEHMLLDVSILDGKTTPQETFYSAAYATPQYLAVQLDAADGGEINFSSLDTEYAYEVAEDDGAATLTLSRTNGSSGITTANISTRVFPNNAVDGTNFYGRGELDAVGAITRLDGTYANVNITNIGLAMATNDYIIVTTDGSYTTEYNGTFQVTVVDDDNVKYPYNSDPGVGNDDDGSGSIVHSGVVRWADADSSDKTLDIALIDATSAFNNQIQVEIDDGSVTGTAKEGSVNAALVNIASSASGTSAAYQEYTLDGSDIIVLNARDGTGTAGEDSVGAFTWADMQAYSLNPRTSDSNWTMFGTFTDGSVGTSSTIGTSAGDKAARKSWSFNTTHNAVHYIWVRAFMYNPNGNRANFHITIDNDISYSTEAAATMANANAGYVASNARFYWTKYVGSDATPTGTRIQTSSLSTGVHTLDIYSYKHDVMIDKIVITSDSAFDPSGYGDTSAGAYDAKFGPDVSTISGGVIEDNEYNYPYPISVLPSTTMSATTLYPPDGAANVPLTGLVVSLYISGATLLVPTSTTITTVGGTELTGTVSVNQTGDVVSYTLDSQLSAGIVLNASFEGVGFNSSGVYAKYSENWSFTMTTATGTGNILLKADFSNRSVGYYLMSHISEDFQYASLYNPYPATPTRTWDPGPNTTYGMIDAVGGSTKDFVRIVNDPLGNTGRGNVLRVKFEAQNATNGGLGCSWRADFTPQSEVYAAWDVFLPTDFFVPIQMKFGGLVAGTSLEHGHSAAYPYGTGPWVGLTGCSAAFQLYGVYGGIPGVGGSPVLGTLRGDADTLATTTGPATDWLNATDPTDTTTSTNRYHLPLGRWITIEEHWKINTADSTGSYSAGSDLHDGLYEVWITDPAIGWLGKKVMEKTNILWFWWDQMGIDGFSVKLQIGGDPNAPGNKDHDDFYVYLDNFIISTDPITH